MPLIIAQFLCFLVSESCNQEKTDLETLREKVNNYLDSDPTTVSILERIYNRPMTPQFKVLLHLPLNNLLVSSEVLASTSPNGSIGLKQAPDFVQKENLEMLTHLDSEDKREQYKADYENLSNEIAAKIDIPFETQCT